MADGQSANTLHENSIGWIILLAVLAVLLYIFWYFFHAEIRDAVRWVRYSEMWLISWFVSDDYTIIHNGREVLWEKGFEDTPRWQAVQLTDAHLSYFSSLAMQPLKWLWIALCALGALWCIFKGPRTHYRAKLGIEGLIHRQSGNFPVIAPFFKFNPANQPPRPPGSPVPAELPIFAEALGPEEWLAYHNIPAPDGQIDREAAGKAFRKQLIGRWKGTKALKPHQQILLAAFCLKAARKRSESDDMLGRLTLCWDADKGLKLGRDRKLLGEARKILKNKDLAGKTIAQMNRHAFVTTAMLRALNFAREEGGVLAPAQFVWLRAHERTLWYPLNNLGRQAFHPEALGAMSHYRAEKITQRPIPVPKLEDAVDTMIEYMGSLRARPIPALDYSHSKKRGVKKAK